MSNDNAHTIPAWKQLVADIKAASNHDSWKELAEKLAHAREEWRKAQAKGELFSLEHSMLHRCYTHDYRLPGFYMITITAIDRKALPFGKVKGDPKVKGSAFTIRPDKSLYTGPGVAATFQGKTSEHQSALPNGGRETLQQEKGVSSFSEERALPSGGKKGVSSFSEERIPDNRPRMEASEAGIAVLEALSGINTNYPMVTVRQAQLMPDHLHLILDVSAPIVSHNGKPQHLGQIIAGYKKGCNRAVWALTSEGKPRNTTTTPQSLQQAAPQSLLQANAQSLQQAALQSLQPGKEGVSSFPEERKPVWSKGYTDTIIHGFRTLDTESAYLYDNPRRLRIKQENRDLFRTVRHIRVEDPQAPGGWRDYAALGNIFLLRKSWKQQVQYHHWEGDVPEGYKPCSRSWNCTRFYRTTGTTTEYHTLGAPIVGKTQAEAHTERILSNGDAGAVHISPFISDLEKAVRDALLTMGAPYIRLTKEGFTDLYTPSKSEFYACAEGLLLILAPWDERYRKEKITRPECLELNRRALALAEGAPAMMLVTTDGAEEVLSLLED